jgi:hypothetical protein
MKGFFDQRKTGFRVYRNEAEAQEIFQQKTRVVWKPPFDAKLPLKFIW